MAYWLEDHESGEEVEDGVEPGSHNSGNLVVGGEGDGHHTVVCEVEEGEEHDVGVPEELQNSPFVVYHGEGDHGVEHCLNEAVGDLDQHLQHGDCKNKLARIVQLETFDNGAHGTV